MNWCIYIPVYHILSYFVSYSCFSQTLIYGYVECVIGHDYSTLYEPTLTEQLQIGYSKWFQLFRCWQCNRIWIHTDIIRNWSAGTQHQLTGHFPKYCTMWSRMTWAFVVATVLKLHVAESYNFKFIGEKNYTTKGSFTRMYLKAFHSVIKLTSLWNAVRQILVWGFPCSVCLLWKILLS